MEEMRNEFGERVIRVENAEEFLAAVQVEAQDSRSGEDYCTADRRIQ